MPYQYMKWSFYDDSVLILSPGVRHRNGQFWDIKGNFHKRKFKKMNVKDNQHGEKVG